LISSSLGIGLWEGVIVSAGIHSSEWGPLAGLPYSEIYHISVQGAISSVPLPAAAWLFSSGLIGLIGLSRRKK